MLDFQRKRTRSEFLTEMSNHIATLDPKNMVSGFANTGIYLVNCNRYPAQLLNSLKVKKYNELERRLRIKSPNWHNTFQ